METNQTETSSWLSNKDIKETVAKSALQAIIGVLVTAAATSLLTKSQAKLAESKKKSEEKTTEE